MGRDSVAAQPATPLEPRSPSLLGHLPYDGTLPQPLGGLNPYNHHFDLIGQQFQKLLIEHAGYTPRTKILDVGCGTGRLAKQIASSHYCGFDVHRGYIDYCQTTYYNGTFQHCDVFHDEYNPTGVLQLADFEFPYTARSFDLVVLLAVCNHFWWPWVAQYFRESSRVLKPRGILFCTGFLLNQQTMEFINSKHNPPYSFIHRTPQSWHDFATRPLFNVAHPEEALRRVCLKSNLMLREPIRHGEWCGSRIALAGPDVIIAQKN